MIFRYKNIFSSIIVVSIMMLFSCKNEMKNIVKMSEIQKMPELSGSEVYMSQTEFGKKTLSIYTPQLLKYSQENSLYSSPRTLFPEGIRVVHFSIYPDTLTMIRADYAILYENEEKWEAKNNVIAQNAKGEVLRTEYLIWNQKAGKIFSDKQVQITTEDDIIEGTGFEADDNFENWEIQNVTGIFTFSDAQSADSVATDSLKVPDSN
ncbi:MAG: LPS export ABC transporter periplasmic protein LptC [Bacteroidales bacterium]|jgi:LPS export ABC transporter protein LptC|nr:LPS export ABC transporter periplasmic protein LptC [Bacteroidales bacterium]